MGLISGPTKRVCSHEGSTPRKVTPHRQTPPYLSEIYIHPTCMRSTSNMKGRGSTLGGVYSHEGYLEDPHIHCYWLRQITWLWDEGTGGSTLRSRPVCSREGTGPLICSLFWASDWLRQMTWGGGSALVRGLLPWRVPSQERSPHFYLSSLWFSKRDHMGVRSRKFPNFDSNST